MLGFLFGLLIGGAAVLVAVGLVVSRRDDDPWATMWMKLRDLVNSKHLELQSLADSVPDPDAGLDYLDGWVAAYADIQIQMDTLSAKYLGDDGL